MSEKILRALMQLFAILANAHAGISEALPQGDADNESEVVRSFLKELLSLELVEEYLGIYRSYIDNLQQISQKKDGSSKRLSLNSVKVLRICSDINKELVQKQKIIVLIRLIEFVNSDSVIAPQELEFIKTVAESFNISDNEFNRIKDFVESPGGSPGNSAESLLIDGIKDSSEKHIRHIYCENLDGKVYLLFVASVNMYVLRYNGSATIYLNSQVINPNKINIFNQGASIRNPKIRPIYYSDVVGAFLSDKSTSKIVFEVKHIDYFFNKTRQGLHDINLKEESGKLVGIMGGSGAGKSTLLKILNGASTPTKGEVLINGINIHSGDPAIIGQIGYIPQDDLLIEDLTVFQNLFYSCLLYTSDAADE